MNSWWVVSHASEVPETGAALDTRAPTDVVSPGQWRTGRITQYMPTSGSPLSLGKVAGWWSCSPWPEVSRVPWEQLLRTIDVQGNHW